MPQTSATTTTTIVAPVEISSVRHVCWCAILAGTAAAIGIHILLSALGTAINLAAFSPLTDAEPIEKLSGGAAVAWSLCALISLFIGGWVAGRFSPTLKSGWLHGMLVWSVTLMITVLLLSLGVGMAVGGAVKIVGEGLGAVGKAATTATGKVAEEGVKRGADQLSSFVEEAVQSVPTNAAPKASVRARREVGMAVTRLFGPGQDLNSGTNRTALIQTLVNSAGMSEADATTAVNDWTASAQKLKAELQEAKTKAEQQAKEAADKAARQLARAAGWTFFAFLVGLIVACAGGKIGATACHEYIETYRTMETKP